MLEIDLQKYLNQEIELDKISFEPIETYRMVLTITGQGLREHLDECILQSLKEIVSKLEDKNK